MTSCAFICAIDFGTSGTGFAWAPLSTGTLATHRSITIGQWNNLTSLSNKTRTSVVLDSKTNSAVRFGEDAVCLHLRPEHRLFDRFKMQFYERTPGSPLVIMDVKHRPLDAFLVMRACLSKITENFLEQINNMQLTTAPLTSKDVLWVLTVPAIWDAAAKDMMKRAAAAAFNVDDPDTQIVIALEPAPAAFWCLSNGDIKPAVGEVFMMVDCGGGTLDVTINEVVNAASFPPVAKEVYPVTGGDYGSNNIDNSILEILKGIFGQHRFEQLECSSKEYIQLKQEIENAKCIFSNQCDACLSLPESLLTKTNCDILTDQACVEAYNEQHGTFFSLTGCDFVFPREELSKIFHTHIRNITAHINGLLKKCARVKYIIVVGNFAASHLLCDAIKTAFHGKEGRVVIVPKQPGNATMRGAVIYGSYAHQSMSNHVLTTADRHEQPLMTITDDTSHQLAHFQRQIQTTRKAVGESEIKEWTETFEHFDRNRSGTLDYVGFKCCLYALGYDMPVTNKGLFEPWFDSVLAIVDPNGDGVVLFEDFLTFMISLVVDSFPMFAKSQDYAGAETANEEFTSEQIINLSTVAVADKVASGADELMFLAGDHITIRAILGNDRFLGECQNVTGLFSGSDVRIRDGRLLSHVSKKASTQAVAIGAKTSTSTAASSSSSVSSASALVPTSTTVGNAKLSSQDKDSEYVKLNRRKSYIGARISAIFGRKEDKVERERNKAEKHARDEEEKRRKEEEKRKEEEEKKRKKEEKRKSKV